MVGYVLFDKREGFSEVTVEMCIRDRAGICTKYVPYKIFM